MTDTTWVMLTAIGTCVLALGSRVAVAGVIAAFSTVRNDVEKLGESKRDRHVVLLRGLVERWADESLEASRLQMQRYTASDLAERARAYIETPSQSDAEFELLLRVPNFFEDVALLVELGGVDLDMVWRAFAGQAIGCWGYWRDAIAFIQNEDAGAYVEYETLVRRLEARPAPRAQTTG